MRREFQVFVKPVGARCNLDCHYCYYLEREPQLTGGLQVMSGEVLEKYITGHLEASSEQVVMFSWHGGEPTLAGIDFYKRAVEIQKKHQIPGIKIINGIQTNGTLLNKDWCAFLKEEGFVVGISMDGPPALHDRFRVAKNLGSSFTRVLQGYNLLMKYGIQTEVLCVVNAVNVLEPLEIYRFYKELGVRYLTFLPLVEREPGSISAVNERTVPPRAFGEFLCTIFDEWVDKDIGSIKIQIFEEAARSAFKQDHTLCIFKKRCGGVPVIGQNGDFYSCDHYVDPQNRLGNITRQSLVELLDHPEQVVFGESKELTLPQYCRESEVLDMCNGECPKNRFITTPSGDIGLNYLCEGYKLFFNHCGPFVDAVAAQWG
ncbi:MAG: anaerobic sulfatase maturase [Bacteroidales bacterium]|nr:anaerobic sulfatase maturase [Bacteroidales bacterium]